MSKRILIIGFLIFALSMVMVAPSFAAVVATATNNAGVSDKVYVTGVEKGDIVKVYPSPYSTAVVLGKATAPGVTGAVYVAATITVKQLIANTATVAKNVYVGVTKAGQTTEVSPRIAVLVALEQKTLLANVNDTVQAITNNGLGVQDTVYITGLIAGDIVKLYDDTQTEVFAKATAAVAGSVTLKTKQLTNPVYYTVTRTKPLTGPSTSESDVSLSPAVAVSPEVQTVIASLNLSAPVVTNNVGVSDTVYIYGFIAGDIVKLYDTATQKTLLAKATATTVKGAAYSGVTLKVKQFTTASVYYTVIRTKPLTGPSLSESSVSGALGTGTEGQTTAPLAGQIAVVNNKGSADTITVTGLIAGDIVRVYASDVDDTIIGKATVAKDATSAQVKVAQLGPLADDVYVTVTRTKPTSGPTLSESDRVGKNYSNEP